MLEAHTGADDSWQSVAGDTQLFLKHDPLTMGWRVGDHVGLLVSKEGMYLDWKAQAQWGIPTCLGGMRNR